MSQLFIEISSKPNTTKYCDKQPHYKGLTIAMLWQTPLPSKFVNVKSLFVTIFSCDWIWTDFNQKVVTNKLSTNLLPYQLSYLALLIYLTSICMFNRIATLTAQHLSMIATLWAWLPNFGHVLNMIEHCGYVCHILSMIAKLAKLFDLYMFVTNVHHRNRKQNQSKHCDKHLHLHCSLNNQFKISSKVVTNMNTCIGPSILEHSMTDWNVTRYI